jgi:hypothetical protein
MFQNPKFTKTDQFSSEVVEFCPMGVTGNTTPGTTSLDLTIPSDCYFTGLVLSVKNAAAGDYATIQAVHPVLGVVRQFGDKYYMTNDSAELCVQADIDMPYCSALNQGLIVRLVYTGSGVSTVVVNYRLHKAL